MNDGKRESKKKFDVWCDAGKPKSGPIYIMKNVLFAKDIAKAYFLKKLHRKIRLERNYKET